MSLHDIIGMRYSSFQRLVSGIKRDIAYKVYHMINSGCSTNSIRSYFENRYDTLYHNQDIDYETYLTM